MSEETDFIFRLSKKNKNYMIINSNNSIEINKREIIKKIEKLIK